MPSLISLLWESEKKTHSGFEELTVPWGASSLYSKADFKAIYLSFFGGLTSVKAEERAILSPVNRLNINREWT